MSRKFDMSDYVTVAERITAFHEEYPDGSLQAEIVELTDSRVTMKAFAYRFPEDQRPGVGHSSLEIPGSTPYTKGSEIENAESSSWGRAIAALGFEVRRGVASADEVRNKQPGPGERRSSARSDTARTLAPADKRAVLAELMAEKRLDHSKVQQYADVLGFEKGTRLNDEQMDQLIAAVRGHGTDQPLQLPLDDPALPDVPEVPTPID